MRLPWQKKDRSRGESNRMAIVTLVFQLIFVFMAIAIIVYAVFAALLGSSLFIPRDAAGVLRSVQMPTKYQWISESARKLVLPGGYSEEQFAYRSAAINSEKNVFLANTYGVLPTPTIYISDKRATIRIAGQDIASASDVRDGTLVTDACAAEGNPTTPSKGDDAPISTALLELPSANEILQSSPRLIEDKATFRGKRAWLLEFDPDAAVIEQLLWRPFLRKALQGQEFTAEREWIETPEEQKAIEQRNYDVLWAYAWVLRDSRELAQIRIRFNVNLPEGKKIEYHLLGHLFSSNELEQIDRQSIGGDFLCQD